MNNAELEKRTAQQAIQATLADVRPSWISLPPSEADAPVELRALIDAFDAGERPAASAASAWFKAQALRSHPTSRTRVLVDENRIAGFYSLASAQVALSQRDRRRLGVDPVQVPAALVTWIAKDARSKIDGKTLLLHATATARQAAAIQATTVLVVDAFDEETAAMWRERFGFRRSAEQGYRKRLWLPLQVDA